MRTQMSFNLNSKQAVVSSEIASFRPMVSSVHFRPFAHADVRYCADISGLTAHRIHIRLRAQRINVLKPAIENISFSNTDCEVLPKTVLAARQDSSNTCCQIFTETTSKWSIIKLSSVGNLDPALVMLPISLEMLKDPSEYLPISSYAPLPNEQWASCTSPEPTPRSEAQIGGLAGQLIVSTETPPVFETRLIKTQNSRPAPAPLSSLVPTSPPMQHNASINGIRRRLYTLSAHSELQLSAAEASMTASSVALLAHQTGDSQLDSVTMDLEGAYSCRPPRHFAELCDHAIGSKALRSPRALEGSSQYARYNHTGTNSGVDTAGLQIGTDVGKTSLTAIIQSQQDRATGTEGAIFELAAPDTATKHCASWPASSSLHPVTVGSQTSTLEVSSFADQSRHSRTKTRSWQPPCSLTWPTDHPATTPTQLGTRYWSSPRSAETYAPGNAPYCATAWGLQLGRIHDDWQSQFTSTRGLSDMVCKSCKSRVPTQEFKIRCKSSVWEVSERFMARSHKPSLSRNGNAQLGCVFCPVDQLTFKSRNEFWAHLETHSAINFESDADIAEAMWED